MLAAMPHLKHLEQLAQELHPLILAQITFTQNLRHQTLEQWQPARSLD
jgi:hypothetical protein